jgi:hypothetical protein
VTPHQALALGVRLFAIWYALVVVREVFAFLTMSRPQLDPQELTVVAVVSVVSVALLLILWFFPKSIARGLLPPTSTDAPTQALSYQRWFTLGTALLGLWFVASSIAPILRNLSVMYVFRPELINSEDVRSLRVGLLYYAVELALGLCLLFGATGVRKLIWRIRHAGSLEPSNSTPHTDARASSVPNQPPPARAGERER